jgi:hypothetical protein
MLKAVAAIGATFVALAAAVVVTSRFGLISYQLALLMLVALFGLYLGFGVLIAVYRFTSRLK